MPLPLFSENVTWVKVPRPTLDIVGLVLGSIKLAGVLLGIALTLGVLLGVVFVLRSRRRQQRTDEHQALLALGYQAPPR